jgi:putative phage-type endonuclease
VKLIHHAQGSEPWLSWRRAGLGGSDIATIIGVMPFDDCTRENVLREKTEGWEKPTNFAMRRGTRLEPVARSLYEQSRGCTAQPVCVEHDDYSWMRVSLDGLCVPHGVADADPWILELKCASMKVHELALEGIVVDYYRPQCQWQLLTCGLELLHFCNYSEADRFSEEDRLAVVTVEPDKAYQVQLWYESDKFWQQVLTVRRNRESVGIAPSTADLQGGF